MSDIRSVTYEDAVVPTLSDSVADPLGPFAGFYCANSGNVKIQTMYGSSPTFVNVLAGVIYPVQFTRIWSTGTTASTNILALTSVPLRGATR